MQKMKPILSQSSDKILRNKKSHRFHYNSISEFDLNIVLDSGHTGLTSQLGSVSLAVECKIIRAN